MSDTIEAPINSSEPAFGRAGLERDAGLVPLPDESKEETPAELTKEEAADERLKQLSGSESAIKTWTSGLPDNVTLTAEQAGQMLAEGRRAENPQDEKADDIEAEQNRIDELRGEKPAEPKIETDEDVERVLKSPKVKEAISAKIGEAETQRQHHEAAVAHTTNFAIASLFAEVPELSNLHPENWVSAIQNMHQREPARAELAISKLRALGQVEEASQQIKADKAAREQAEMKEYTTREQARYVDLIKDIPARKQAAVAKYLPKMFAAHGTDMKQFVAAIANQTQFPRSVAQAFLVKAALYDLIQQAPSAVAMHDIPNVQRPGFAGPRVDRADASLASLSAKLSKTGNLKDAAALLSARRSKAR